MNSLIIRELKVKISFSLFIVLVYSCTSETSFDNKINGIWKIDSTESYNKGIKGIDSLDKYYWDFNEYNDLIFFNKDSIIQIHYFKVVDSLINCYNSKKDTADWAFQLRLLKKENDKIVLQSIFEDNTAVKFFMTKTKIDKIENIIRKKNHQNN